MPMLLLQFSSCTTRGKAAASVLTRSSQRHNAKLQERLLASTIVLVLSNFDLCDEQIKRQVSAFLSSSQGSKTRVLHLQYNLLTDRALVSLFVPASLQNLNLAYNLSITDFGMCNLAPRLGNLSQLVLNGITNLTVQSWKELAQGLVNIKFLELKRCGLYDDSIQAMFSPDSQMLCLRQLHLSGNYLTDESVQCLSRFGRGFRLLQVLSLDSNRITDASISNVVLGELLRQSKLQELNLARNIRISDLGALELTRMLKRDGICLRGLKFDGFNLSHDGFKEMDKITMLTKSGAFALVLNLLAKFARLRRGDLLEKPTQFPSDLLRALAGMLIP